MATNFVWRGGGWADVGLCPYLVMITVVVVVVASATAAAACRCCFCHYCSCLCFVRLLLLLLSTVKGCKLLDQYQSFLHEIYSLSIFTTKNLPYVGPGEY